MSDTHGHRLHLPNFVALTGIGILQAMTSDFSKSEMILHFLKLSTDTAEGDELCTISEVSNIA